MAGKVTHVRTIDERERLAYISGNVELAAVLGEIIDGDSEALKYELLDAEHDIAMLQLEVDDLYLQLRGRNA